MRPSRLHHAGGTPEPQPGAMPTLARACHREFLFSAAETLYGFLSSAGFSGDASSSEVTVILREASTLPYNSSVS